LTNYIDHPIIATGGVHTLFRKADGTVWTSDLGNFSNAGQTGQTLDPNIAYGLGYTLPILRETNILGAVAVAAGDLHSLVLKWNGTILAFGENQYGQLGIGNTVQTSKPTLVTNINTASHIAAGYYSSMAVLSNGLVKAWGLNNYGQLGIGNTTQQLVPTNVLGLTNITMLSCGYNHTLALDNNGHVWAFGDNSYGEIGDGTTTQRLTPVSVTNLTGIVNIAAGDLFSLAVDTNGTLYSWGENTYGELGIGRTSYSHTNMPTRVTAISNICFIAASSAVGYAVDNSNRLWGWGHSFPASLGTATPASDAFYPLQQVKMANICFLGFFDVCNG